MNTPSKIVGRQQEQQMLEQMLLSKRSEFLAVYGRRRVGKTFLVKTFFEYQAKRKCCRFFYCSGIQDAALSIQLGEFSKQIGAVFYGGASIAAQHTWHDALAELTRAMQQVPAGEKIILFFDEFPWMATPRSGLLQALDYAWNRYWSHDPRIKLIICGSSASWIIEKIINNKGGLYNRVTQTLNLQPFTLAEAKAYLHAQGVRLNQQQVLDLYMVLGGIPHYLSLVRKGLSAHQSIDALCFRSGGALVDEFERLFASLFQHADIYIALIRIIAKQHYGVGQAQLIKNKEVASGGRTVQRLRELEDAGFIMGFVPHGHKQKGIYYRVIDEFSLFYLTWIEPNKRMIAHQQAGYWISVSQQAQWRIWAGYAYESICYKHIAHIRQALNIEASAQVASWRYVPRDSTQQGAQIDLLFDRYDGVITVCEIKYNSQPYVVDKAVAKNLLNKVAVYKNHTKTNKQIFIVMVTANGIKPTLYSEEIIDKVLCLDDLFG